MYIWFKLIEMLFKQSPLVDVLFNVFVFCSEFLFANYK